MMQIIARQKSLSWNNYYQINFLESWGTMPRELPVRELSHSGVATATGTAKGSGEDFL
jgi:hypothetical protein